MTQTSVLDKGYVALLEVGNEIVIAEAATASTGRDVPDWERLVRTLLQKGHLTPFEFVGLRWEIYAPVFVRDQMFRHRTFSFVAQSQRYSKEDVEYYVPTRVGQYAEHLIQDHIHQCELVAEELLEANVPREIATRVRPSFRYTRWAMRTDLRNLMHFLQLRLAGDTQWETRQYAGAMYRMASTACPVTFGEWDKHYQGGKKQ